MKNGWWIEEELFNEIRRVMPIAAVDLLVVYEGRLLLMLRNNEPVKDVWFTPGGRVRFGETLEQACLRKLGEETGLEAVGVERKGVMGHLYPGAHYVTTFFRVDVVDDRVVMNDEHRDYRWVSDVAEDVHPYVRHMIGEAGIFKDADS